VAIDALRWDMDIRTGNHFTLYIYLTVGVWWARNDILPLEDRCQDSQPWELVHISTSKGVVGGPGMVALHWKMLSSSGLPLTPPVGSL
jgi:hypothetical protein